MLGLKLPSDPRWVNLAEKSIEEILIDHAFCEQKAASSGISLIVDFPEREELVNTLTPLIAEEWAHFERVVNELNKRGLKLKRKRADEYVLALKKHEIKGGSRESQLMERLLIFALIEARSCERFKMLWQGIEDADLKKFYYEFMVSEAGHYRTFMDLAKTYMPTDVVEKRWEELLLAEAEIIKELEIRGDRVH
jgi:tRNA 2-(methylsulfanyl)-N6-isopentenyladenosine37 hydroxylase